MTSETPKPTAIPEPLRARWHSVAVATALRHARLLELTSADAKELTSLPVQIYRELSTLIASERDRACKADMEGCRTPKIEQTLNINLWNFLKGFSRDHSLFGR
jgi:hypothetical protein